MSFLEGEARQQTAAERLWTTHFTGAALRCQSREVIFALKLAENETIITHSQPAAQVHMSGVSDKPNCSIGQQNVHTSRMIGFQRDVIVCSRCSITDRTDWVRTAADDRYAGAYGAAAIRIAGIVGGQ